MAEEQIELTETAVIAYLKSKGLIRTFGLTPTQIGKHFGKTGAQVARFLSNLHKDGKINKGTINGAVRYSHIS